MTRRPASLWHRSPQGAARGSGGSSRSGSVACRCADSQRPVTRRSSRGRQRRSKAHMRHRPSRHIDQVPPLVQRLRGEVPLPQIRMMVSPSSAAVREVTVLSPAPRIPASLTNSRVWSRPTSTPACRAALCNSGPEHLIPASCSAISVACSSASPPNAATGDRLGSAVAG